jgi:hypothetical protein
VGALAHRFRVEQALSVSAIIFGATLCALLNAPSEAWVAVALIAAGFLGGVVDVLMNAEGAWIERGLGRPILARLPAAASPGMALGAILGSLIDAGPAPWAAGVLAAFGLASVGVAYHRAAGADRSAPAASSALRRSAWFFAPALIGLGVLLGVSIAAELRASVWSTLLLREEAPKSVAGFALTGVGAGPIVPCGFAMAARESAAGPAVGLASATLFSALSRLPAPLMTGAIGPGAVAAGRVCPFALVLATTAAAAGVAASMRRAPRKA